MSNRVIPAEMLTQYQRWEMSPIFEGVAPASPQPVVEVEELVAESIAPELVEDSSVDLSEELIEAQNYPTPEELESIHQAAFEDGYQAGLSQAQDEITVLKSQLESLIGQLDFQFSTMQIQLADDLVELSVRLAEQVLRQTLVDEPARLGPIVQEAISASPFLGTNPRILMHPDDVLLLQDRLNLTLPDGSKWQLIPDGQINRGDCRLLAAEGEVDLSLEIRWKRVLAALGR
ncbi:hypothetical protein LIN78_02495 [Leeia sp. TBRC 13508]|uniref:Flagellar assembly protein FliH n=1 Tax=Leeia speluncae TaxID=2884804 RepID=A0ABS8D2K1_9NEIS|nr:FliH/SctL family protein [Leeia speluncae]MCB6182423.1 hypothetical protein [Leeia speluncae]